MKWWLVSNYLLKLSLLNKKVPAINASSKFRLSNLFGNTYFAVSEAKSIKTARKISLIVKKSLMKTENFNKIFKRIIAFKILNIWNWKLNIYVVEKRKKLEKRERKQERFELRSQTWFASAAEERRLLKSLLLLFYPSRPSIWRCSRTLGWY